MPAGGAVVVADLASEVDVIAKLMEGADAVVHLAAIASETDFVTAVDSHLGLTHRVLDAAVAQRCPTGGVRQQQPRRRVHAADTDAPNGHADPT